MEKKKGSSSGLGVVGVVQIIFIILKLTGLISWNWWLVLMPIEIVAVLFVVAVAIGVIAVKHEQKINRRK